MAKKSKNKNKTYNHYPEGRPNKWASIDNEFYFSEQRQRAYAANQKKLRDVLKAAQQKEINVPVYRKIKKQKEYQKKWNQIHKQRNEQQNVPREIYNPIIRAYSVLTNPLGVVKKKLKENVCGKRHTRRKVLFSLGRAGKGVAGPINKIKNITSNVRC